MNFTKYSDYQITNLSWLEKLPNEWKILRGKNVFRAIDIRSNTGNEQLLSVSEKHGVTQRKNLQVTMFKAESYVGHKLAWPGDLVINSLWAWMGGLGFSQYHGIVSTAYGVYRPKETFNHLGSYFNYLVRSNDFRWELRVKSKGIWRSRYQLSDDGFLTMPILIPPVDEAHKIVRYLDFKCAQINQFIQKKKRLITLLKEQKQAIINQAVTRGLDPNDRLKPSGVEWLGDVPEHWIVYKLGQLCIFNPSKSEATSKIRKNDEVTFLAMENISVEGELINIQKRQLGEVESGFTFFKKGDVVIAKITPCFENGKGAFVSDIPHECGFGTTELIVLRPSEQIKGSFLYWITRSSIFRDLGEKFMVGAAGQKRVPSSFVKTYSIGLPPVHEQDMISNYIKTTSDSINYNISIIEKEIDLIQEYRTRLISDVVTGKIDVRNIKIEDFNDEEAHDNLSEIEELDEESLTLAEIADEDD